jgi:hypothetical protein
VPTAAAPAARAAFLATCLTFGRSVFFVVLRLFVLFAFLVFDVVRARFNEDLAFVRLTLFFMILPPHNERPVAGPNLNTSGRAGLPFVSGSYHGFLLPHSPSSCFRADAAGWSTATTGLPYYRDGIFALSTVQRVPSGTIDVAPSRVREDAGGLQRNPVCTTRFRVGG